MKLQILTGKTEAQATADAAELKELRHSCAALMRRQVDARDVIDALDEMVGRAEQGALPFHMEQLAGWRSLVNRARRKGAP